MSIPVLAALLILIALLIIFLWRKVLPDVFTLPQQLLLTVLVIALLRLLSLPI